MRLSYLYTGNFYTDKMVSIYWDGPQVVLLKKYVFHDLQFYIMPLSVLYVSLFMLSWSETEPEYPVNPTSMATGSLGVAVRQELFLTHLPLDKMAATLAENDRISIRFSLRFVPRIPIDNKPALVQVMTWCRTGNKPLPEPMLNWFSDAYMQHSLWPCDAIRCHKSGSTLALVMDCCLAALNH